MKFNSVLFDFDGTLADTQEDVWTSLEFSAAYVGGKFSETFRNDPSNLSLSDKDIFSKIEPRISEEFFEVYVDMVKTHYRKINEFLKTDLYPGIEELLKKLNQNQVSCYIVTMKPLKPLEKILFQKGWNVYFKSWISPDYLGESKLTKTEMIHSLLMKDTSIGSTIYIGDTFSDMVAASANKVPCIGVLYGDGDAKLVEKEKPDFLVRTVNELENILL